MHKRKIILPVLFMCVAACAPQEWTYEEYGTYVTVSAKGAPVLGVSKDSGVEIIRVKGKPFKDLNRNGKLDAYEDWRLSSEKRAENLASLLSVEQIAGLMLYSAQQNPKQAELDEKMISYLGKNNVRHVLLAKVPDALTGAQWANNVQAYCEKCELGIPANISSDPRNYTEADAEFNAGSGGDISHWPREVGMAATFDIDLVSRHGRMVSKEYRALGITTALSPQVDLSTDPRWRRFYGTFSESPELNADIAKAYCDAFQTTPGSKTGWGMESVNCMVKHWPGGGTGEAGRDAHFCFGKYAVYPGNCFELSLIPFVKGAFSLNGATGKASAVMPYYTISYGQDPSGENVANAYSKYIISDLLRGKYGYEGVVCTDWGVVYACNCVYVNNGKPWGVETLTDAERRLRVFEAGCDQLGGVQNSGPSIEAYALWEQKYGSESARERFELSAKRLLVNIFNVGVFENPYVNPEMSASLVGCQEFMEAGYEAQLKSVVMVKNHSGALPVAKGKKVYIPSRHVEAGFTHWGNATPEQNICPIEKELASKYYEVVDSPSSADFALVYIKTPFGHWGYLSPSMDKTLGDEGLYYPISLQWGDYTATEARDTSIAGGDPLEKSANRSYKGRTEHSSNVDDMLLVQRTRMQMGEKPVIVVVETERPFVPAEIEPSSDVLMLCFGVSNQAILDLVSGEAEPYGLLPLQLPANMRTVELQCEDKPFDMECYVDADGHTYDFAYGMNWGGVIDDDRVRKYRPEASSAQ